MWCPWAKKLMEIWYLLITVLVLMFPKKGNTVFFWAKKLIERWYLLIAESSSFELFGDGKYCLFWVKKLMERWYLLVTEKFLFWTFWWWEIRSFFSQKVDGKVIFTWPFWAFHDIPGPGKYGFSCSVNIMCYWEKLINTRISLLKTWLIWIY